VDWTRLTESKAWKDATVSWQGYGISILECAWYYIHRIPQKGPDHQQRVLHSVNGALKRWNQERTAWFEEEKSVVSSRQFTGSEINKNEGKIHRILQIWPQWFFLFADLKKMLAGNKFSTNEEVIAETVAYFEGLSKSYYKNGIEKLYDRYNRCITLEGNYIE
jgi:hypothetical protein